MFVTKLENQSRWCCDGNTLSTSIYLSVKGFFVCQAKEMARLKQAHQRKLNARDEMIYEREWEQIKKGILQLSEHWFHFAQTSEEGKGNAFYNALL